MTSTKHHNIFSFLVDVNLPKRFSHFNSDNFVHVADVNPKMTDDEIWDYAVKNNKVILTKDGDFYDKFISSDSAPKIIQFQLGNTTLKELHEYFNINWDLILTHISDSSFIIAKQDQIIVFT